MEIVTHRSLHRFRRRQQRHRSLAILQLILKFLLEAVLPMPDHLPGCPMDILQKLALLQSSTQEYRLQRTSKRFPHSLGQIANHRACLDQGSLCDCRSLLSFAVECSTHRMVRYFFKLNLPKHSNTVKFDLVPATITKARPRPPLLPSWTTRKYPCRAASQPRCRH